jgi:hypothetical protein
MIARTIIRALLGLAVLVWSVAAIAPAAASHRNVGLEVAVLLIVAGAVMVILRLVARRWVEAHTQRAQAFWGYAAPAWAHDASGLVLMLVGLCLFAWWA